MAGHLDNDYGELEQQPHNVIHTPPEDPETLSAMPREILRFSHPSVVRE